MKNLPFIKTLKKRAKTKFFTDEDLKIFFCAQSNTAIHNSLSYHLKNKDIIKFKRGLYCLASDDGKFHFSKFSLANVLYCPSYISFESALSFYGLIPEAVYEVSSACFQPKHKKYDTDAGAFSYSYIPVSPFFLDVEKDVPGRFLIATPTRALFDLIYSNRKVYRAFSALEDDLRIDVDELEDYLKAYRASEIMELGEAYKKKSTRELSKLLIRNLK